MKRTIPQEEYDGFSDGIMSGISFLKHYYKTMPDYYRSLNKLIRGLTENTYTVENIKHLEVLGDSTVRISLPSPYRTIGVDYWLTFSVYDAIQSNWTDVEVKYVLGQKVEKLVKVTMDPGDY
jgi:hypothetical protein